MSEPTFRPSVSMVAASEAPTAPPSWPASKKRAVNGSSITSISSPGHPQAASSRSHLASEFPPRTFSASTWKKAHESSLSRRWRDRFTRRLKWLVTRKYDPQPLEVAPGEFSAHASWASPNVGSSFPRTTWSRETFTKTSSRPRTTLGSSKTTGGTPPKSLERRVPRRRSYRCTSVQGSTVRRRWDLGQLPRSSCDDQG